jgi:hypothetical protein
MATFNYYLRNAKSTKATPIVLWISVNGVVSKISTGESIEPKYWDNKKQEARPRYTGSPELNKFLTTFSGKAQAAVLAFKNQDIIPSTEELRKAIEIPKRKTTAEFRNAFESYISAHLDVHINQRRLRDISRYSTT